MIILPKAIYRFNAIHIKIPTQFFNELKRAISKFIWNNEKPRIELKTQKWTHTPMVTWSLTRELKPSSGKDSIFNKWCWHNWRLSCWRMRIDPFLSPCTKIKSKWIKELHIKPVTVKLIQEKLGNSLEDMGTGEKFLNRTAMACAIR